MSSPGSTGSPLEQATAPVRFTSRRLAPKAGSDRQLVPISPDPAGLVDGFGRLHDDLRLSITDRCNLRCTYCLDDDVRFQPRDELLSGEELVRVARVAKALGVRSLRITGGEPLVRRDVLEVVEGLAGLGFEDVSLTTNGTRLKPLAARLAEAGLDRVNISCDSLRPDRFASVRRRGRLEEVLEAMAAAEAAGLSPVKVNVVLMRGVNDDEIVDFAEFARRYDRVVRFIELMPLDAAGAWDRANVVPSDEVIETIAARWPLAPAGGADDDAAPAERYRFADGRGEIGVIATVTRPFCGTCNRLRVTADGMVRNCLFSDDERSLRELMRAGASDDELAQLMRATVGAKRAGHGIDEPGFLRPRRSMSMIGG